jgi:putative hydroxymethylpyrimidine transport system substrate-binding protein
MTDRAQFGVFSRGLPLPRRRGGQDMRRVDTPARIRRRPRPVSLAPIALALSVLLPAGPAQAEKLTLLLDWFLNPDHATLVVAEEKGFFAEAGLEVEMIEPADPNDPPKLVAAGQADLAVSYQPQLHIQAAQGLPLARVGTLIATPLNTLLVLDDGPIHSIADLKGRRVGYSVGGFEDAVLSAMLAKHGLSLDDIELVNVNFSLSPALLSGQVDAVIGAFRNFELNQLAIEGHEGRAFYVEEEGVPAYDELILVAHRERLADPRIGAFLGAVERAVQYLVNHPEDSWALFVRHRKELDDELNRRAWRDTLPRFALRPRALDRARYEAFAAFLKDHGVIETSPPIETYAVEIR